MTDAPLAPPDAHLATQRDPRARRAARARRAPARSVGHQGKFGHEFLEFEFRADGRLRYANNSNYKNDVMIRKEGAGR